MCRFWLLFKTGLLYWLSWAVVILPSFLKILIYRRVFGYKFGKGVKIGLSWLSVRRLEIGDHVFISHFVRFKNIPEVKIGNYVTIGVGNTFTSTYEFTNERSLTERGNRPTLIIGDHCGIAMLHYFDIQDTLTVGSYTTIAGKGSVFFTHYLDVVNATQATKPIHIGEYCMLGSSVQFAPGVSVPNFCVVAMGAVVTEEFTETHCLIAGNPATIIRNLPEDAAYFRRTRGWIGSYTQPPHKERS
jgi:acetyltransferase-like isoleucine patch superfamily enzyme